MSMECGWDWMEQYEAQNGPKLSTPPPLDPKLAERQAERIICLTAPYEVPVDPVERRWAVIRFDHLHEMGELEFTTYRREAAVAFVENFQAYRDQYPDAWAAKHKAIYRIFRMEYTSAEKEADAGA